MGLWEGAVAQVEQMALYPDWPPTEWSPDTIVIGRYRIQVDTHLPPGEYDVRVGVVDTLTGERIGEPIAVAALEVQGV